MTQKQAITQIQQALKSALRSVLAEEQILRHAEFKVNTECMHIHYVTFDFTPVGALCASLISFYRTSEDELFVTHSLPQYVSVKDEFKYSLMRLYARLLTDVSFHTLINAQFDIYDNAQKDE
jgi:hypothetical protein